MARVSLAEQYDDKDVIKQIYLLWDAIDQGAVKDLDIVREGGQVKITVTFHDDEVKEFTLEDDEIQNVTQSQSGSQVTITIVMKSGTTYPFTFTAATGVTLDTDQTVTGMKVFSAASTNFSHDVDVGADLNVGGTVEANELTVDTNATVDQDLAVGGNLSVTGELTGDLNVRDFISFGQSGSIEHDTTGGLMVIAPNEQLLVMPGGSNTQLTVKASGVEVTKPGANDNSLRVPTTSWVQDKVVNVAHTDQTNVFTPRQIIRTTLDPTQAGYQVRDVIMAQNSDSSTAATSQIIRDTESKSLNLVCHNPDATSQKIQLRTALNSDDTATLQLVKGDSTFYSLAKIFPDNSSKAYGSTTATDESRVLTSKAYVESTDGTTNNLVHRTADETIAGTKTFENPPAVARVATVRDGNYPWTVTHIRSSTTGYSTYVQCVMFAVMWTRSASYIKPCILSVSEYGTHPFTSIAYCSEDPGNALKVCKDDATGDLLILANNNMTSSATGKLIFNAISGINTSRFVPQDNSVRCSISDNILTFKDGSTRTVRFVEISR